MSNRNRLAVGVSAIPFSVNLLRNIRVGVEGKQDGIIFFIPAPTKRRIIDRIYSVVNDVKKNVLKIKHRRTECRGQPLPKQVYAARITD